MKGGRKPPRQARWRAELPRTGRAGPNFPNRRQRHKALHPHARAGIGSRVVEQKARPPAPNAGSSQRKNTTKPNEKSNSVSENARAGRHRHGRGQHRSQAASSRQPDDLHRRGRQGPPVHLAHHPDLVLPLPKARRDRHGKQDPLRQGQDPQGLAGSVQEAIDAVLPKVHGRPKRAVLYRLCIEQGLAEPLPGGPNTFSRLVNASSTCSSLRPNRDNKHRLAFAKAHANEMWQADTLFGPYVQIEGVAVQTRLIAFLDDASRVCCHGQFFPAENVDTLIEALRAAFYKRGVPDCSVRRQRLDLHLQGNHPDLRPRRLPAGPHARTRRRGQGKDRAIFSQRARTVPRAANWTSPPSKPSTASSPTGSRNTTTPIHSVLGMSPWTASPWTATASASSRPMRPTTSCSSSRKTATCAPTTPSPSNPSASKLRAICPSAPSRSASSARSPPPGHRLLQGRAHGRSSPAGSGRQRPASQKRQALDPDRRPRHQSAVRPTAGPPPSRPSAPPACLPPTSNPRQPSTLHSHPMIRSHFGLQRNPFDTENLSLLEHQQQVLDILGSTPSRAGCAWSWANPAPASPSSSRPWSTTTPSA